jgi:hypothetical protein
MTYQERKLSERCTRRGCSSEPSEDHLMCPRHRDEHRERNRQWWARREQLSSVNKPLDSQPPPMTP